MQLSEREDVPLYRRIVLQTTQENVLVRHTDLPLVISAFRQFSYDAVRLGYDSSLQQQIRILQRIYEKKDVVAVGWSCFPSLPDNWSNRGGNAPKTNKDLPYNCLTMAQHQWINVREKN